jgi:vancomycin resistance protein YoaR
MTIRGDSIAGKRQAKAYRTSSFVPQRHPRIDSSSPSRWLVTGQQGHGCKQQRDQRQCHWISRADSEQQSRINRVKATADARPIATPISTGIIPCLTISRNTSRFCAPSAKRKQISCFRWVTVVAITP